jgi:hypothetical protein
VLLEKVFDGGAFRHGPDLEVDFAVSSVDVSDDD